jgi:hypothetical protein
VENRRGYPYQKRWKAEATSKITVGKKKHINVRLCNESPKCALAKATLHRNPKADEERINGQSQDDEKLQCKRSDKTNCHEDCKANGASMVEARGSTFMLYKSDKK